MTSTEFGGMGKRLRWRRCNDYKVHVFELCKVIVKKILKRESAWTPFLRASKSVHFEKIKIC
jgi:hypothetical protein